MAEHEGDWSMSDMCRALGVTRQGYYAHVSRPPSAHDERDLELARLIGDEYEKSRGVYGAAKVFMMLKRKGVSASKKRVARIMGEYGRKGVTRGSAKRPSGERRASKRDSANDLARRDFKADGPNRAWFADITYVRTHQGWLYLAVVMDAWSRRVVGWSVAPNITAELADDALKMAIARRRPPEGCMHHSDHGAQHVSLLPGGTTEEHGIRPSMGAISSPWDNAPTESLMGIIKSECVHARTFDTREQAALEIFEYIERFYNKLRIHSALDWLSPEEFEDGHYEVSRIKAA